MGAATSRVHEGCIQIGNARLDVEYNSFIGENITINNTEAAHYIEGRLLSNGDRNKKR